MSAAPIIMEKLRALGAQIESNGDRLILRAGNQPVPELLVAEVRAAKAELLTLLTTKVLTPRCSGGDEHLRQKTGPNAAENLAFYEDAHSEHLGEHLREGREQLRGDDEHLRQDPQKRSCSAANHPVCDVSGITKMLTKVLTPEHLRRGQDSCGFEGPETPKVLTLERTSGGEHLRKPASAAAADLMCCECGLLISEQSETWWGGERCHRTCGEAAFKREKARRGLAGMHQSNG
jgi:hypothetical protein